ncbi:MAG: hypothetical protein M1820_007249 [Bogoriella megaspora]|nr:MAG: hypothetical protein M1820_007249 [Bogoriella megaspora]
MLDLDSHMDSMPTFDYTPTDNSARPTADPDLGTLMMILACYQQILGAFETICLFMQQRVQDIEMNSLMGFSEPRYLQMPPAFPQRSYSDLPPPLTPPSDTLQFIMIIKLTSDLLSRLDRALAPLVGTSDKPTSSRLSPVSSSTSSSSSSIRRVPSSEDSSDRTTPFTNSDFITGSEAAEVRSTSNILTMRAGDQLRQQQSRLRILIKAVKRLVRSQKV